MAARPKESLPQQMGGWAELKGAYRLLAHPKVSAEAILGGHQAATVQRSQAHARVLAIQDTTAQSFTHRVKDDGPLNQLPAVHGQWVHTVLALSGSEHQVLGVLHQQVWARAERSRRRKKETASARKRGSERACAGARRYVRCPKCSARCRKSAVRKWST